MPLSGILAGGAARQRDELERRTEDDRVWEVTGQQETWIQQQSGQDIDVRGGQQEGTQKPLDQGPLRALVSSPSGL